MTYRRSYRPGRSSAPLTPPADLVGKLISYRPKNAQTGERLPTRFATCLAYDAAARTLTLEVQQAVHIGQPNPTRTITIALSQGPFSIV